jgi:hypothetical protein
MKRPELELFDDKDFTANVNFSGIAQTIGKSRQLRLVRLSPRVYRPRRVSENDGFGYICHPSEVENS